MKAQWIALMLHFGALHSAEATAAARKFLAAMPPVDGTPSEPWFESDAVRIARPRTDDFESGLLGISLKNRALAGGNWGGTLRFLNRPPFGSAFLFSTGFAPDVKTVWRYMREVAISTVAALHPVTATLGGLGPTGNPAASLREIHVPRVFAPWTYVLLEGLSPELALGLRSLPDCTMQDLADGIAIEAVGDIYSPPTRRFVQALGELPVTPRVTYQHLSFPTPDDPA